MKPGAIRFLTAEDVFRVHRLAMLNQGVEPRLRDPGILDAALGMSHEQFSGECLHTDIPSMAAAYAFHIVSNHPFEDGNKRAAAAAMILFLCDNGWSFDATADEAESVIFRLAAGELNKQEFTKWVSEVSHEKPSLDLRDFFGKLRWNDLIQYGDSILNTERLAEIEFSIAEVSHTFPMAKDIADMIFVPGAMSEDLAKDPRFVMLIQLVAIYRIAEDMGYEW